MNNDSHRARLHELDKKLRDLEVECSNLLVCMNPINTINVPASDTSLLYYELERICNLSNRLPIEEIKAKAHLWNKAEKVEREHIKKLLYKDDVGFSYETGKILMKDLIMPDGELHMCTISGALEFQDENKKDCCIFSIQKGGYFESFILEGKFKNVLNKNKSLEEIIEKERIFLNIY